MFKYVFSVLESRNKERLNSKSPKEIISKEQLIRTTKEITNYKGTVNESANNQKWCNEQKKN